jgi:hypothetical protein
MIVAGSLPGGARVVMRGLVQVCFFGKNHMIPYQDTCIRFMKTAEPFSYKKGFPPNHIVTISPVMGSMMTDI